MDILYVKAQGKSEALVPMEYKSQLSTCRRSLVIDQEIYLISSFIWHENYTNSKLRLPWFSY